MALAALTNWLGRCSSLAKQITDAVGKPHTTHPETVSGADIDIEAGEELDARAAARDATLCMRRVALDRSAPRKLSCGRQKNKSETTKPFHFSLSRFANAEKSDHPADASRPSRRDYHDEPREARAVERHEAASAHDGSNAPQRNPHRGETEQRALALGAAEPRALAQGDAEQRAQSANCVPSGRNFGCGLSKVCSRACAIFSSLICISPYSLATAACCLVFGWGILPPSRRGARKSLPYHVTRTQHDIVLGLYPNRAGMGV